MRKAISGTGCCLIDSLYTDVRLEEPPLSHLRSRREGDGGLEPGKLVFSDDLARFAGLSEAECVDRITRGEPADTTNLGGPGVVAMVHASQFLTPRGWSCRFYGAAGAGSEEIKAFLNRFPLESTLAGKGDAPLPSTIVLSDPTARNGAGERTFVNRLGSANLMTPEDLGEDFFEASLFLWGGTALVPPIHDKLSALLKRAKEGGGINVVGTVYDFRNVKTYPGRPWPLGNPGAPPEEQGYPYIDLLLMDEEEALCLSGRKNVIDAAAFFTRSGCGAFIITRGREDFLIWARKGLFRECPETSLPVSRWVNRDLEAHPELKGDTTGCGDNFMGGALVSLALQLEEGEGKPDVKRIAAEGACAGGLALYTKGGCYMESAPGEKAKRLKPIREAYLRENHL